MLRSAGVAAKKYMCTCWPFCRSCRAPRWIVNGILGSTARAAEELVWGWAGALKEETPKNKLDPKKATMTRCTGVTSISYDMLSMASFFLSPEIHKSSNIFNSSSAHQRDAWAGRRTETLCSVMVSFEADESSEAALCEAKMILSIILS